MWFRLGQLDGLQRGRSQSQAGSLDFRAYSEISSDTMILQLKGQNTVPKTIPA